VKNKVLGILSLVAGACLCGSLGAAQTTQTLLHSPDSVVDLNPNADYVEPSIASDSMRANTLVVAASPGALGGTQLYVSDDGGYDWRSSALPLRGVDPLGDVQVAASPSGAFYFTVLGSQVDANGKGKFGIQVFASSDHGNTFQHVAFLRGHGGYDHEQLAIGPAASPLRDRVYMSVLYSVRLKPQVNACGLLSSSDGRHFEGPARVVTGWCFNSRPVVLANGTILFPYIYYAKFGEHVSKIEIATSKDGGHSFGPARTIGLYTSFTEKQIRSKLASGDADFDGDPVPQYATDGRRVYAVWSDLATGVERLLFARSLDSGLHWSAPRAIVSPPDRADAQYQASMAVNGDGTLAIAFLRASEAANTVTEMVTASRNHGATFFSPVDVETVPARLGAMRDSGYSAGGEHLSGQLFVGFTSVGSRFTSGGDYVGMAADRAGAFHPVWVDARTGDDQVWTDSVQLAEPFQAPPNLKSTNVTDDVDLQFGAGTWDPKTRTLALPVRLHNIGTTVLYPPFSISVLMVHNPYTAGLEQPEPPPAFENSDNGKTEVGAAYTYGSNMLGNLGRLLPGADTATRIWRIHIPPGTLSPSFITRTDAYVAGE
jgi:hypothetical protein